MGLLNRITLFFLKKLGMRFCPLCDNPAQVSQDLCYSCDYEMAQVNHAEYIRDQMEMVGATPYLASAFGLNKREARTILASWMEHYDSLKKAGVI